MTRFVCKQTQLCGPDSIIGKSVEVENVDDGAFPGLMVNTCFALFPMFISKSEEDSSTFNEARLFRFSFGGILNRLSAFYRPGCTARFILAWRV